MAMASAASQQRQETSGGPEPITDHCSEHHPSSGHGGALPAPQGPRWEAAGGAHPLSTCWSMASASSVPSSCWEARLWSRALIWALAWARKASRKRSPCRGKDAAPGTVSHEGQLPGAIPAHCYSPGLPLPAGHSLSQKPIQRAPAASGSHEHFWPSRATSGFFPGMPGRPSPPRDGQRCRMPHQRHGDSRACPDPLTCCPPTSSLARRASSARCLMASRSSRQLRSLPGTLSSTARQRDTRALACSCCKRRWRREAPGIADGCCVCRQHHHLPKPGGKGGPAWLRRGSPPGRGLPAHPASSERQHLRGPETGGTACSRRSGEGTRAPVLRQCSRS